MMAPSTGLSTNNPSIPAEVKIIPITATNSLGPTVCSEYWVDWFMMWGQKNREQADLSKVTDNFNHMYSKNASINIYMIHGGTNFGFMNGAEWNGPVGCGR